MDINPPQTSNPPTSLSSHKVDLLNLKLNQQIKAKVISTQIEKQTITLQITQAKKSIQVQSSEAVNIKAGQTLQLIVTKLTPTLEFKVLNEKVELNTVNLLKQQLSPKQLNELILKQLITPETLNKIAGKASPLIAGTINAKIISISAENIQLKLFSSPDFQTLEYKKFLQQNPIISLTKKQYNDWHQTNTPNIANTQAFTNFQNLTIGQQLLLEANTSKSHPEFKIIGIHQGKLQKGQIISAQVINLTNNKIQLQLSSNNFSSIFTLDKNQLANVDSQQLKKGQLINLEVIKTIARTEFKLIDSKFKQEQKIQDIFKQALPIQEQPAVLLNQIIDNLPSITKNENISTTLKRLAREIVESLTQNNSLNPKKLKQAINNSGLFLEAKLAQDIGKQGGYFKIDFKNQLLKFHRALKKELNLKQEQKATAEDVKLLKEMQQKTESTIAKIVLNQLTSLPKEEGQRQVWLLDLPFFNNELADSVEVKIDKDQQNDKEDEENNWSVTVTITPPELGTIHCKISCYDKTINTLFWSDTQTVVTKITSHLDYLKTQFEKAGINPGHMSAHAGIPRSEAHQQTYQKGLFDQKV